MDEPFGALDPITRAAVRRDFRELDELRRKTVVLVTHDVAEAFELADRIMLLNQGQIQQLGAPRELLREPANDFVRQFFQAERLGLEMRVTTLAELRPFLPGLPLGGSAPAATAPALNAAADTIKATPPLPWSASLQEALEQLAATPGGQVALADWPQPVGQGQLLAAFGRWLEPTSTPAQA
jgi:osmoprotectant transport system ATP-binding protein